MRLTLRHTSLTLGLLVASVPMFSPLAAQQNAPANIAPQSANGQAGATPTWSTDQLLTSTVHEAWLLSNKNEATFFQMVTQLAEISAKNRNLELPESADAGRRVGEMIKQAAKADHDALLYAVVDSAVRKVAKPIAGAAAQ